MNNTAEKENNCHSELVSESNKPDYKKTELGWIPKEWEMYNFGKIVKLSQYGLSISSVANALIPMLRMNNINNGKLSFNDLVYVELNKNELENFKLQKDDLVFNRTNSAELVGKTALFESDRECVFASYLIRFKLKSEIAHPKFISYFFNFKPSKKRIELIATKGVSQSNINPNTLQKFFNIILPPLPEQQKIAQILTSWDNAIEKTEKLIESKQKRKKALTQRLLTGKLRFPEFAGQKVNVVKLKDYLKESSIKNNKNQVQNVLSVTNSRGFINQDEQFERSVASKDLKGYKIVKKGQFAYNPSRINVGSIDLLKTFEVGIVSPIYVIFETKEDELLSEYLKHFFKTYNFFEQMKAFTQGGVRDSLSFKGLSMMKMFIPSVNEQKKIVAVLNSCDREIELLKQKLNKLNEQKKGLMQKLLTGQVRVKVQKAG